jgi:hypothetical protein
MTDGFQHQAPHHHLNRFTSAPTPQHGAKADKEVLKRTPPRRWEPKPGPH